MSQVMLEDAGSQLAQLVEQARQGEEVIILRDSTPVAKLVPLSEEKPKERQGGFGSGKDDILYMADDFDAPSKAEEKPEERQGWFGSGKYALVYMADDFDAPLEDFKDYM